MSWKRPWQQQQLKMEEWPAWPLNQWLLLGLLKRGIQASASEENQSMARPLSSALMPALKEKASSQGCGVSGWRIWAILHDSRLTCGTVRQPLVKIIWLSVLLLPAVSNILQLQGSKDMDGWCQKVHCRHLTVLTAQKHPS